jgi:hypothetical protein
MSRGDVDSISILASIRDDEYQTDTFGDFGSFGERRGSPNVLKT